MGCSKNYFKRKVHSKKKAYHQDSENSKIKALTLYLKKKKKKKKEGKMKLKTSTRKEITKIRADINGIETKGIRKDQ